jgi:hypothetical protein
MDFKTYRDFEKSCHSHHLKKLAVLDRQISICSVDELNKYMLLVMNAKVLLFHGVIKYKSSANNQNGTSACKSKRNSSSNGISICNDVLVSLNVADEFVRDKLMEGFRGLRENFFNGRKASFEVK